MTEGERLAFWSYRFHQPKTVIHQFEKVPCPVCGHMCGGKSGFFGDHGRLEGVHQHMKVVHGIKQKWKRSALLEQMKEKE